MTHGYLFASDNGYYNSDRACVEIYTSVKSPSYRRYRHTVVFKYFICLWILQSIFFFFAFLLINAFLPFFTFCTYKCLFCGEIAKLILDKFNKVISKNKRWENIEKINQILIGETTSDDDLSSNNLNLDNYVSMKYAPITSVDVERSFSMYKNILSPNRNRSLFWIRSSPKYSENQPRDVITPHKYPIEHLIY
ncbi:Dimer Tnp hAT domain-containing protein [Aphis craccivora]|uniref:Dimer Tnp hAT domain-containing protein n=1 Tax=Aphis craccivora TaxID=307492 RepID=A0A6G0ZA55_APHCR|nr:Dimer Tnp hAT domain-containing protein [Aphis craccivora]